MTTRIDSTRTVTQLDQLENGANWLCNGKLYLLHCVRCDQENWAPVVASGICAWCGWGDERGQLSDYTFSVPDTPCNSEGEEELSDY